MQPHSPTRGFAFCCQHNLNWRHRVGLRWCQVDAALRHILAGEGVSINDTHVSVVRSREKQSEGREWQASEMRVPKVLR